MYHDGIAIRDPAETDRRVSCSPRRLSRQDAAGGQHWPRAHKDQHAGHTHRLSADSGGVKVEHDTLGSYRLDCNGKPTLLFCQNDTNPRRHYGQPDAKGFFKDTFHEYLIAGNKAAVSPANSGARNSLETQNVPCPAEDPFIGPRVA